MKTVTRFAPSPTGSLHVGSARTAIFNWLFSRGRGGEFVLRIEDTDRARSEKRFEDEMLESLAWLGLDWSGDVVRQSGRLGVYGDLARRLLDEDRAYRCYVTAAELEARRAEARGKNEVFRYRREWSLEGEAPGKPFSVRFSVPEGRTVVAEDAVRGPISFETADIEDFVILRADGFPTYNFAAAVDDALMEISHVIRGDDHIINAPRQILVAEALGFSPPVLAHVPMILGGDGKKLSKRHGAESLAEYRSRGYLPEAALNYLVRLGWSHGDQEIFTREELVEKFSLEGLGKSPAVFDPRKFLWLNGRYVKDMPEEETARRVVPFMEREGFSPGDGDRLGKVVSQLRERSETLGEMALQARCFFTDDFEYDPEAARKFLAPKNGEILAELLPELRSVADFSAEGVRGGFERVMERSGLGLGKVAQPARVALTGGSRSPGIFEVAEILGRDAVARRLERALEFMRSREVAGE